MIAPRDFIYCDIPWKAGGRTRDGLDCAGLAALFLEEEFGLVVKPPDTTEPVDCQSIIEPFNEYFTPLIRGDTVFFKHRTRTKNQWHVATALGDGRILHILNGAESRLDNGFTLLKRCGLIPVGIVRANDAPRLALALKDANVGGDPVTFIVMLVISLALAAASYALSPKLSRLGNKYGRYGFDALVTQNTPEVPLPDLLGAVVVAGNSPYTQLAEKGGSATASSQKANKIIVLASGPSEEIDYQTGLKINGLGWNDPFFKNGTNVEGININPAQTKAEAVTGSIAGDTNVPSVSLYTGAYGITVPVDVRAQYDREFPIYGLSGCTYQVFRLIDSTKFQNFNVTTRVKCRKCRTFNDAGFVVSTAAAESLAGADGSKVRFKLAFEDVQAVSSVAVNGTPYAEISASAQTGDVYQLNKTKGFVEFLTAPSAAATVLITYTYYVREWSQNPAVEIVYLLTEKIRGMGFDEGRFDWVSFSDFRDHCYEVITWQSANGPVTEARYVSNYAVDFRKPVQEHIKAILDASMGTLFLSNGKFTAKAKASGSSVFSFTEANIVAGSFTSELLDRTERANRVKILFHSDEAHNAETEVIVDDVADQAARAGRAGNNGIVEENLKLPAVTVPSQAERLAEMFLREMVGRRWMSGLTTTTKGLALQPGDVVDLTHSSQPTWAAKEFYIENIDHDAEDRLVLSLSEYLEEVFI